jgi:hypothetical protein
MWCVVNGRYRSAGGRARHPVRDWGGRDDIAAGRRGGAEGIGGVPGVQRGAVEKCAGERDVIGPPFGDDGFGLLRIGNHADRLERDLAAASDGLHKRHLITGPGRSPACGAIPLLETHT